MTAFDANAKPVASARDPHAADADSYPLHERRKHERLDAKGLACLLGEVVDISEGGAQIHFRGKLTRKVGDTFAALLRHEALTVVTGMRIARVEKVGFRRYNLGIEFVGLEEMQRRAVAEIAAAAHESYVGPQAYVA